MRRFLLFPLLFAGLCGIFRLVMEASSHFVLWIMLRFSWLQTDVYYHSEPLSSSPYVPFLAFGVVVGLLFAALDFALHFPDDRDGSGALQKLLEFRRLPFVAFGIVLLNNLCLQMGMSFWESHRRYHAYIAVKGK